MGRISRILKSSLHDPISSSPVEKLRVSQGSTPTELGRVIANWPRFPPHFKDAILALVEIVESTQDGYPYE